MAAGALVILSLTIQQISRRDPSILMRREIVISELLFALLVTLLGGYVYKHGTSSTTLAFASQYILASALMAGVSFGMSGGLIAGAAIGLARVGASIINHTDITDAGQALSLVSTTVTYCLAGALVGGIVTILRKAGGELSEARARDNIARVLHDGVLQTLVIIQRRSKEPDVVELAAHQEQDLRSFLFTHNSRNSDSVVTLHNALEDVVESFSKRNQIPVSIVVAPDVPRMSRTSIKAITGACTECLSNIAKHSGATSVTIYAEPEDEMCVVSVHDDGIGFDADSLSNAESTEKKTTQQGIRSSIMGRIDEIGGTVTIRSSPTTGTEVEMRVPFHAASQKKDTVA